ncbi:MAG: O-antigen ligase family protein, partial [Anaerolineae bacterium]
MVASSGAPLEARPRFPAHMPRHILAAMVLLGYLAGVLLGARWLWRAWQEKRFLERGIGLGRAALVAGQPENLLGTNVSLEQYDAVARERTLDAISRAGFGWVRQRFPWDAIEPVQGEFHWDPWDDLVGACHSHGLQTIAVLDRSPSWARAPVDAQNPHAPPRNPGDFATFARKFAQRYGQVIDHYQVWDEPNIQPHWGERDADPAGYVALLRAARTQIRDVDSQAQVLLAGLAPTTERGPRNLNEVVYLRGIYQVGGGTLFDLAAAKPYGFWSGPEDRVVSEDTLNFSRVILLCEEMVRQGDVGKPLWAVAWGWNSLPEGWQGRPSPWGTDEATKQVDRDLRAWQRARQEWPWLGVMCWATWQPDAPADDPVWGFALVDAQGTPGPLYGALCRSRTRTVLYPGYHRVSLADEVDLRFWGNRVDLLGTAQVRTLTVDGAERPVGATDEGRWLTVASGLPLGEHQLRLIGREPTSVLLAVVREPQPLLPAGQAGLVALVAALATVALIFALRGYPWRRWLSRVIQAYRGLSSWRAFAMAGLALGVLALAPNIALSVLALAFVAVLIAIRVDVGLMLVVALIPWAPLHKAFGPVRFSLLEIATAVTVIAQVHRELVRLWGQRGGLRGDNWMQGLLPRIRGILALDWAVGALMLSAFISLAASEYLRVSLRELRTVVLLAVAVYWLVARTRPDRAALLRLADLTVLSAFCIGLQGTYQYLWTERTILAEGVRRMRGIYGSPNNLALVLGRLLPLMLALALCPKAGTRRWFYAGAALAALSCLFLTFSRGAWVFGLPAGLVALALLAGRRAWLVVAGLAVLGLMALVPLLGTVRVHTLFSLQGTNLFRLRLWEAAWEMVRDHPLWGVGLDNFLYQYPRYMRPDAASEPNLSHPHNVLLDFWLRLGVPGLLAFVWVQVAFFREALALWKRRSDSLLWAVGVGLTAGMVASLAHGLVDITFFVPELAALCGLMLGIVRRLAALMPGGMQN